MMLSSLTFEVNVFPLGVWKKFAITRNERDARLGYINVAQVYKYARRVLSQLDDETTGVADTEILYDVGVILNSVPTNVTEIVISDEPDVENVTTQRKKKKLSDATLTDYDSFIDFDMSAQLVKAINDTPRESLYEVVIKGKDARSNSFVDARVILFPAMRDLARLLYKSRPSSLHIPASLGYTIDIYSDAPGELEALRAYNKEIKDYNKSLSSPLPFIVAIENDDFPVLSRLIFVAKRANKVIGYCGCVMLPYRVEIAAQMEAGIDSALKLYSPLGEKETDQDKIINRYLMGVRPTNIFEIEGLSASPNEAGKQVGLALLYEAMRFIRDERMSKLYPVSHVGSQAASYITKRYLTTNFDFRYHGSNHFLNEGFLETLDDKSKSHLVTTITDLIQYYNTLSQTVVNILVKSKKGDIATVILDNVVKLYQLYYLLLRWARPHTTYTPKNEVTLTALITLINTIVSTLSVSGDRNTLRNYLVLARASLTEYRDSQSAKDASTLLVKMDSTIAYGVAEYNTRNEQLPPRYGFVYPREKTRKKGSIREKYKVSYKEGYDVIYSILPNICEISGGDIKLATHTLALIDDIVRRDLALPYDYQTPVEQLVSIRDTLAVIQESGVMGVENEPGITETLKMIEVKLKFLDMNVEFNRAFTIGLYHVSEALSTGFDSFISFKELASKWTNTEKKVLKKFTPTTTTVTTTGVTATPVINQPPLFVSSDREQLFMQINALYEVILPRFGNDESLTVTYNGATYSIGYLYAHYNTLQGMINVVNLDAVPDKEVETELVVSAIYRLEDFIDDDDEEEEEDVMVVEIKNVLNKTPI